MICWIRRRGYLSTRYYSAVVVRGTLPSLARSIAPEDLS